MPELATHDGVTCDVCKKSAIQGLRFKCLICYDFDLCQDCQESSATALRHLASHPVQCILNPVDYPKFYGGEQFDTSMPLSLTCSYCGLRGFDIATLSEHLTNTHPRPEIGSRVLCPICCANALDEPNSFYSNLTTHFNSRHPVEQPGSASVSPAAQGVLANMSPRESPSVSSPAQSSAAAPGNSDTVSVAYGGHQSSGLNLPSRSTHSPPPRSYVRIPMPPSRPILGPVSFRPNATFGRPNVGLNSREDIFPIRRPPMSFFSGNQGSAAMPRLDMPMEPIPEQPDLELQLSLNPRPPIASQGPMPLQPALVPDSSSAVQPSATISQPSVMPQSSMGASPASLIGIAASANNSSPNGQHNESLEARLRGWVPSLMIQPSPNASIQQSPSFDSEAADIRAEEWGTLFDAVQNSQSRGGANLSSIWGNAGVNPPGSSLNNSPWPAVNSTFGTSARDSSFMPRQPSDTKLTNLLERRLSTLQKQKKAKDENKANEAQAWATSREARLREEQEINSRFSMCDDIIKQFEEEMMGTDEDDIIRGLYAEQLLLGTLTEGFEEIRNNFRMEDFVENPEEVEERDF